MILKGLWASVSRQTGGQSSSEPLGSPLASRQSPSNQLGLFWQGNPCTVFWPQCCGVFPFGDLTISSVSGSWI